MDNINFTANLIKHTVVPKISYDNTYKPSMISVIELNKNDTNDINALRQTSADWYYLNDRFSYAIYNEAVKDYEYGNVNKEYYYAITEQKDNFDKPDYKKILGLMLFSDTKDFENEINFLQVRPDLTHSRTANRAYKNIGENFIDLLKDKHNGKTIIVKSLPDAKEFYEKQGFKVRKKEEPLKLYLEA